MKKFQGIVSLVLAFLMVFTAVACTKLDQSPEISKPDEVTGEPTPESTPTESTPAATTPGETTPGETTPPESTGNNIDLSDVESVNVIFALATIPPVLSALEAIKNGDPTFVIIERGKTYSGIASLENFINVGFDPTNNLSTGFTEKEFNDMIAQVKAIKEANPDIFINFYVQDGTALFGAAIAANAGVDADHFHVYMCEDGTGAYNALYNSYLKNLTVTAEVDGVYENYATRVANAKAEFDAIMAKTDNKRTDDALKYNIGKAFALAALDNFTFYIQDEAQIVSLLENTGDVKTKLLSSFGVKGYEAEVELTLNLKYGKIAAAVAELTEQQRTDYLTLMYGQYYADTYAALTRTKRADKDAPAKKLVYIGARHSGYPALVSDAKHGIGGLEAGSKVPATYAELDAKYKTPLIFGTEADYQLFLDELNNAENYTAELSDEVKAMVGVACFNYYVDYIFNLKFTFAIYGAEYDLIMKGHPREVIGSWSEWGNRYKVTYGENNDQTYVYDKLYDNVLLSFHKNDSTGKYIGMVPYGTAAENLAYLGADIAIAGLPSSTYNGFDTAVGVLFIMTLTDEDIVGTGKDTSASSVKERFEAGNLVYTDAEGNTKNAVFYNTGNIYKSLATIYSALEDAETAAIYQAKFDAWLNATHKDAETIDEQGFAVVKTIED